MAKYTFYSDPGHGWLKVPRTRVEELGLLSAISPYSYARGDYLYLEEDCDAPLFMKVSELVGQPVTLEETHAANASRIRNYIRFSSDLGYHANSRANADSIWRILKQAGRA